MCFKQIHNNNNNYFMCCKCYYITQLRANCKFHICSKEQLEQSKQYKTNIDGKLILNINDIIKNYNTNKEFNLMIDT